MFLGNLYHLLVTIVLVSSKHDSTTPKYPPQVKVFCSNSSYAKEVLRSAALFDHLAIIWTSLDFQNDYYFALSYDRVSDLFLDIPTVHVLLSSKIPNLLNEITPYVPYKSIFIVSSDKTQHSYMDITRLYFDYKGIIFHLYDEQPWNEQESISHATIYQHYKFVFRSYFYKNISNKSFYLPLNSYKPKYFRNFQKNNGVVPSSRRSLWCTVTGKYSYFLNSKFHIVDADDMIAMSTMHDRIIYNNESLRHRSCQMLLNFDDSSSQTTVVTVSTSDVDMAKENILGDVNSSLSPYLDQYTRILATSVFVVCIARNSYETFSHYEAIELGAIPIMVRPPLDHDFIGEYWVDYPGPVFANWVDAVQFIADSDSKKLDRLQLEIRLWYKEFLRRTREDVALTLNQLFYDNK